MRNVWLWQVLGAFPSSRRSAVQNLLTSGPKRVTRQVRSKQRSKKAGRDKDLSLHNVRMMSYALRCFSLTATQNEPKPFKHVKKEKWRFYFTQCLSEIVVCLNMTWVFLTWHLWLFMCCNKWCLKEEMKLVSDSFSDLSGGRKQDVTG